MERENLNALIDRVMGSGGILRTPVYWMKKVLKSIVEYYEGLYRDAANEVNKKAEVYTLPKEGKYATNSATGKKLLDIMNNPDKYMIQRLVDYSEGEILVPYHIYRIDNVTDYIRIKSPAWHTSTGTLSAGREVNFHLTSYRGVISKGIDGDYIEINYEDNDIGVLSTNLDTEMSDMSIWPVQNRVIKAYVDDAVSKVGAEVVDNLESESATAALSANQGRVLKEMIEELPSDGGGEGVKIYQLPSGLFGSSQDNMYYFTAEEQQSFENAVMSADTMFFIAITDLEVSKIINIPLTLEFGLFFSFSGNKVLVSTLSSGEVELKMKIWEFHILDGVRGWMVETEKVIWKG